MPKKSRRSRSHYDAGKPWQDEYSQRSVLVPLLLASGSPRFTPIDKVGKQVATRSPNCSLECFAI